MTQVANDVVLGRITTPRRTAERIATGDRRSAAAAGLGAFLVLSVGLTDGGYFGRSSTSLTIALAAVAGLGAACAGGGRVSRRGMALTGLLAALVGWTALSSVWAVPGALVEGEVRRGIVYVCGLAAVVAVVDERRRRALLLGLVGGISLIGLVAIGMRAGSGEVADRYYGSLLGEPVGYPNTLGVLASLGIVISVGLAAAQAPRGRALRGAAAFLVLVLGLTGSRGAALALVLGLGVLVGIGPVGLRLETVLRAFVTLVLGGAAWGVAVWTSAGGPWLVVLAAVTVVAGAFAPDAFRVRSRRALAVLAGCGVAAAAAIAVQQPIATTSSFRTAYWAAAIEETRARPALGSGGGSFHLTWSRRGEEEMFVRDAHSLYVETLSELGPVGLILVAALVAFPIVVALRRRGDPLTAAAGAAFVVFAAHAGLDWDWEMPVVTLAGLACAGATLAYSSTDHEGGNG